MIDAKKKIDIKQCTACVHREACKYSDGYNEFGARISNIANKLDGEIVEEGIVRIEIECNYFKAINPYSAIRSTNEAH